MGCKHSTLKISQMKLIDDLPYTFLIFFTNDDYKKVPKKKNKIIKAMKLSKKFPGNFIHANIKEVNFKIYGTPIPHKLYIKNKDMNSYILYDIGMIEYIQLITTDAINAFTELRAKYIKYIISSQDPDKKKNESWQKNDSKELVNPRECEIVISKNPKNFIYNDTIDFFQKNKLIYIENSPTWNNLINYIIKNKNLERITFKQYILPNIFHNSKLYLELMKICDSKNTDSVKDIEHNNIIIEYIVNFE